MLKAAIRGSEDLPPQEKADVFRGIAATAEGVDTEMANAARSLAQALEDAHGFQLYFEKFTARD